MELFCLTVAGNTGVAALMALAVALVGLRLKRPAVLHFLWVLVLLKLFLPPLLAFAVLPAPAAASVSVDGLVRGVATAARAVDPQVLRGWLLIALGAVAVWAIGSMTATALAVIRLRRFSRLVADARPPDERLAVTVDRLARLIGCRRLPRVVLTEASISPLVWSALGRPRLVLPRGLIDSLAEGQREAIIAHELAHLKRGDDRVRWLELLAFVVFWWHPVTWVASHALRDAEEACCDAIVADRLPARVTDYATALVKTIRHLTVPEPSRLVAASGLGRPAMIERRITTMFTTSDRRPMSRGAKTLIFIVAATVLALSPMLRAHETEPTAPDHQFTGEPISLTLDHADVRDVFKSFAVLTGTEITVDPDVTGTITVDIHQTPWDQAFDLILRLSGLQSTVEDGHLRISNRRGLLVSGGDQNLRVTAVAGEGDSIVRFAKDGPITEPKKLGGPAPRYPEQARAEGINGVVVMETVIGEDGFVREVKVVRSNADILSDAAVEAVRQWTFEPATREGVPVAVRYVLTVNFRLD